MSVDSYGYQVLSLDELIAELQKVKETLPEMGDQPVWTDGNHRLHCPVKQVALYPGPRGYEGTPSRRIMLQVEKG